MVHHPQIHVGVRAHPAEPVQDLRHPVHGKAGVGRYADGLRLFLRDGGDLVFQLRRGAEIIPDGGQESLAVLCQGNAAVVPADKGHADLPLQTVDEVGQAGLCVTHHLGGLGKAAQVHCRHQDLQLFAVHGSLLQLCITYNYYNPAFLFCKGFLYDKTHKGDDVP